jgi:hypothetical protein
MSDPAPDPFADGPPPPAGPLVLSAPELKRLRDLHVWLRLQAAETHYVRLLGVTEGIAPENAAAHFRACVETFGKLGLSGPEELLILAELSRIENVPLKDSAAWAICAAAPKGSAGYATRRMDLRGKLAEIAPGNPVAAPGPEGGQLW